MRPAWMQQLNKQHLGSNGVSPYRGAKTIVLLSLQSHVQLLWYNHGPIVFLHVMAQPSAFLIIINQRLFDKSVRCTETPQIIWLSQYTSSAPGHKSELVHTETVPSFSAIVA